MKLSSKTVSDILERFTEEGIITDSCAEYGEPGYTTMDAITATEPATACVVLGDYWCHCNKVTRTKRDGTEVSLLHDHATHHPHLWKQLEAQGVCFEWYDEWTIDYEHSKAYRAKADSYSWKPSFVYLDDGEILTPDDDLDVWLEWACEGDEPKCLMGHIHSEQDLFDAGFQKHNGRYENGFHEGQNDNPKTIMEQIRREYSRHTAEYERLVEALADTPIGWIETAAEINAAMVKANLAIGTDVDVVFMLDGVGQFDVEFSAYWRRNEDEDDAEDDTEDENQFV